MEGSINKSYTHFTDKNYPIIVLKMDDQERFMFSGSKTGSVFIYKVNEIQWTLHLIIHDHSQEIRSIAISNTLNVLVTSSLDGYVNLYTLPEAKMFRSLSNRGPIDNVFLSAYPIPCVLTYSDKSLITYAINGQLIHCEIEEHAILSPIVFTDINFNDFLVEFIL